MKALATPDSAVPSLTASSPSSTDTDDVTRVLFDIDSPVEQWSDRKKSAGVGGTGAPRVHWPRQHELDRDSVFASDASVASFALSIEETSSIVDHEPVVTESKRVSLQPVGRFASGPEPEAQDTAADDVPMRASCPGGLTLSPIQLAGIFDMFDGAQKHWPLKQADATQPSPPSEASTTLTSNMGSYTGSGTPRVESLKHECTALKEILLVDSENILKLKTEQEKLRANSSERFVEIRLLKLELDKAKREKELQQERESQHQETIKILKHEVDTLTKNGNSMSRKKIEQMRLENELFAAQIIENEEEMREVHSSLQLLADENLEMRSKLEGAGVDADRCQPKSDKRSTGSPATGLAEQVKSLAARLEQIERGRVCSAQMLPSDTSVPTTTGTEHHDAADEPSPIHGDEGQDVEVTLNGPVEPKLGDSPKSGTSDLAEKPDGSDESWLCDCFPSHVGVDD